jgi:hypothetical protein
MAVLLIILYLFIPVMGFAHVDVPDIATADLRSSDGVAGAPCEQCPCSDEQGSHCCDAASCSCAFHSPPVQGIQVCYAPVVSMSRHTDSFWLLPQIYSSIFVPPQNLSQTFI